MFCLWRTGDCTAKLKACNALLERSRTTPIRKVVVMADLPIFKVAQEILDSEREHAHHSSKTMLMFQCACCPGRWWIWPHPYPPPRHLGKSSRIRWRVYDVQSA